MKHGGKRKGAGRPPAPPTKTHGVRCTDEGWKWLNDQAKPKSVGKWADENATPKNPKPARRKVGMKR